MYLNSVTAPGWEYTVLSTSPASTCSYSVPGDIARCVILSRQPCSSASLTQLWHCLSIRKALSGASVRMELPQLRIQCVVLVYRLRQICYHRHSQQTSVPPGLRRNTSMPLTTSPPHPHKHMGEPRIPKHPATQTHHPPRSIHSTTRRHQGHQPCESTRAEPEKPCTQLPTALPPTLSVGTNTPFFCLQVQHRPVLPLRCPFSSGVLPAQPQSPELPPSGTKPSRLSEHPFPGQLPPYTFTHGLSGMLCHRRLWTSMGLSWNGQTQ